MRVSYISSANYATTGKKNQKNFKGSIHLSLSKAINAISQHDQAVNRPVWDAALKKLEDFAKTHLAEHTKFSCIEESNKWYYRNIMAIETELVKGERNIMVLENGELLPGDCISTATSDSFYDEDNPGEYQIEHYATNYASAEEFNNKVDLIIEQGIDPLLRPLYRVMERYKDDTSFVDMCHKEITTAPNVDKALLDEVNAFHNKYGSSSK